uniref:NADH-ubiquinone oxidoreductase chain 4 n=1 Tax=Polydora cf. ciliata DS-2023 TaxID=3033393 RepID=A0AA95EKN9_9ANNE|nr:NADH dehydrogenase subunit 4 [Polydora cf. ciliata DS-2023]
MFLLALPLIMLLIFFSYYPKPVWNSSTLSFLWMSFMSLMILPSSGEIFISSHIYMDLLSSVMITLTFFITALMFVASQKIIFSEHEPKMFSVTTYVLSFILIEAYSTPNLFNFYILFEASLIPTLILILSWGLQPERLQAGTYLMMYMIVASLPLLFSIMLMYTKNYHLDLYLPYWTSPVSQSFFAIWWFFTILPFLVKTPIYSVHLWLPKAHVEAPVAGSMILAGVLLKLGSYGLFRVSFNFPYITTMWSSPILVLSIWGACIASMLCLRQTDIKALIAYSSISHMGLVTAGIMSQTQWGWAGALLLVVAHGLASSGLFALANTIYETAHSRNLMFLKGMMNLFPVMSIWWFILSASNLGAPPSINMLSEVMLITATISFSSLTMPLMTLMILLTTAYCLLLFSTTQYGPVSNYINPWNLHSQRHFSISALHSLPIFIMFLKSEILTLWL